MPHTLNIISFQVNKPRLPQERIIHIRICHRERRDRAVGDRERGRQREVVCAWQEQRGEAEKVRETAGVAPTEVLEAWAEATPLSLHIEENA